MRNRYREIDIETAGPERLIAKLYQETLRQIERAGAGIEAGDPAEKGAALDKAMNIVNELRNALDLERGQEVAANLDALYRYVNEQLLEANVRSSLEALANAHKILATVGEAWNELAYRSEATSSP